MQIPNLIRNFIRKRIVSESVLLPFFYPDEGEFESFQEGYRLASRKTGEELALPIQYKLASLGVKFNSREITFSELIARHG